MKARCAMITSKNTVLKITAGKTTSPMTAEIICEKEIISLSYEVFDAEKNTVAKDKVEPNAKTAKIEAGFDARPWSASEPYLYTLTVTLVTADGEEEITDRFGFRYFETDEKYIYLNGFPFYMRAYIRGCAAHEHQNNCKLTEYEFYKKNFEMAKEYGYNTVRFHSVIPPEECFRAGDDCGMLIHIEMRAEDGEYDNLEEMIFGKNDFVTNEELIAIINRVYNHPSFMVYCVGNEIRHPGTRPRIREIRDFIKKHDPTRLFIDTCAHGEFDRDYVDFDVQHMGYYFPYGRNANMFSDTDNLLGFGTVKDRAMVVDEEDGGKIRRGIRFKVPLMAHEVCHYTSWRDFYALKEKFEKYGTPAPWWVDEEIKLIESKGYKDNFAEILQTTKDFQFRAWKNALEGIRSSRLLSGFHMLQFADTDKYENSNGVVDCFDDPHGISSEEFRRFNADTVVLARLPKQIFSCGEKVKIPVLLSQYKIDPEKIGEFTYSLEGENGTVRKGVLTEVETGESGLYEICNLEFNLPVTEKPEKYTLKCAVKYDNGNAIANSWELWAFPVVEEDLVLDATFATESGVLDFATENASSDLVIKDTLDDDLFERLENGENVLLFYRTDWTRHLLHKDMEAPKYAFEAVWDRYKAVIWDRGTINGGLVEKKLLNDYGFVTDRDLNFQYYHLVDDSDKINLDNFPTGVRSIVSGIDKSSRDRFDVTKFKYSELRPEKTMRHFSYLFDLKVGKGKLMVCAFNMTNAKNDPSVRQMLKTIVGICRDESFGKGGSISVEELKNYLTATADKGANREGMMTQYWQLDAEPVESFEYWMESERYLREIEDNK